MKRTRSLSILAIGLAALSLAFFPGAAAKGTAAAPRQEFDSCTSILVGRLASADGSTMTSHSCDSGSDRTWISIVPNRKHRPGETAKLYLEPKLAKGPDDPERLEAGEIPQVPETFAYLNAAYPIMNERQLAIGETTVGGRRELVSQAGSIDAPELFRLCLERARTAREAIRVADELTALYGYNDWGECFTFADPRGSLAVRDLRPGQGEKGRGLGGPERVPDDEIGVSANASRIRTLDLTDKERFLASANVLSLAEEMGFWSKARRPAFRVLLRLRPGIADEPVQPAPGMARPEPARPGTEAQPRIRELSFLRQTREKSHGSGPPDDLPRRVRRDRVRHDPDPHRRQPREGTPPRAPSPAPL